ncbi:MAG: glycerophosphoryl diester phosphodiesterase [Actinomycetota bacterium]
MKLGAVLGTLVVAAAALVVGPAKATTAPTVYAHRGGAGIAPENTMGAFRQAAGLFGDRGVWLEMDTQLTSDGVLVVIHDDSLDRTTNCTGKVISRTAADVTACDASKSFPGWATPEPVPTLEQVLREAKDGGWRLSVELKNIPGEANFDPVGTASASAFAQLLSTTDFPLDHLVVQSFWPPSLEAIEQRVPGVATALLTTSQLPSAPPGVGFTVTSNAGFATARGYEIASPDVASIDMSATAVQAAHALGRQVVVWTVDEPAVMTSIAATGVDGIITNRPDLAYQALG